MRFRWCSPSRSLKNAFGGDTRERMICFFGDLFLAGAVAAAAQVFELFVDALAGLFHAPGRLVSMQQRVVEAQPRADSKLVDQRCVWSYRGGRLICSGWLRRGARGPWSWGAGQVLVDQASVGQVERLSAGLPSINRVRVAAGRRVFCASSAKPAPAMAAAASPLQASARRLPTSTTRGAGVSVAMALAASWGR